MFIYNNYYLTKKSLGQNPPSCPACVAGIPKKSYAMTIPIPERIENMKQGIISEMGHHVNEWTHSATEKNATGKCIHCQTHINLMALALSDSLPAQSMPAQNNAVMNMDVISVSPKDSTEHSLICIFMANTKRFHYDIIADSNGIKCPKEVFLCPKMQAIL